MPKAKGKGKPKKGKGKPNDDEPTLDQFIAWLAAPKPEPATRRGQAAGEPGEREFEVGANESWTANLKRLHDEFLQESLETIRRSRDGFGALLEQERIAYANIQANIDQAHKNMVQQCQLNSGMMSENHRRGFDDTMAGTTTAQGAVDAAMIREVVMSKPFVDSISATVLEKLRADFAELMKSAKN